MANCSVDSQRFMVSHPRILDPKDALLLIIDVQEAFRHYLSDVSSLIQNICVMVEAARILSLPIFVAEQYPKGLGSTFKEIVDCLGDYDPFEKTTFSVCLSGDFLSSLEKTKRKQVMVCGIEAHVCVNQTVHGLLSAGYKPHLITDAISSRLLQNKEIGINKMIESGAVRSSVEMALLEMVCKSGTETFKNIQRLIKDKIVGNSSMM